MVRQHVNPLSRFHQQPRPLPPLDELFAQPQLPLHLDIGAARGRFLLAMAPLHPARNHLGIEIRRPLAEAAEAERLAADLPNLRFLFANANVSLPAWLAALAAALAPGRELFLQSDVSGVIAPMVALVEASGCFERPAADAVPWRPDNPLPVPTEREAHVLAQGLPVYRVLFRRTGAAVPDLAELEAAARAADNPGEAPEA